MRFACLALATLAICVPAQAQERRSPHGFTLGQEYRDARTVGPDTPPEVTLMRTALCVAEDRPEQVRSYLATVPGSAAESEALSAFGDKIRKCMPEMDLSMVGNMRSARGTLTLSFEHSAMRGAMAEALMREEKVEIDPQLLALEDDGMFLAERFHGERSAENSRAFVLGFAGCVLGHNAAAMPGLFNSAPASPEEREAIVAMAPSFTVCLMDGQVLKLRAPTLRNQLAEVVYYAQFAGAPE